MRLDNEAMARANGWDDQSDPPAHQQASEAGAKKPPSAATLLVEVARESVELFASDDHDAYATFSVDGHRETWPVHSKAFRRWLRRRFHLEFGRTPNGQAMADALDTLAGEAEFERSVRQVAIRIAEHDGAIYLDLANEAWEVVEITADGWNVTTEAPVRFRRPSGMLPLPTPTRGGQIDDLRSFVNLESETDFLLVVAWLVAALRPRGPFPPLVLMGEHGTAKSTTARVLRALVDPNKAPIRAEPRDVRDMMITAGNSWVGALDNLSTVSAWLSDALCRLSTGGGFSTRELHSDRDEVIFDSMRPLLLNGIDEIATRGDLIDRAIVLTLPVIPQQDRRDEESFWCAFDASGPGLLGALLDAVATGLRRVADVQLHRVPRMADFTRWAVACEPALGWPPGAFFDAYAFNRESAHAATLESSPLGAPLREIAATGFEGTATELLAELAKHVDQVIVESRAWPKTASKLGVQLRRLSPTLRELGINVEFSKSGNRLITVTTQDGFGQEMDGTATNETPAKDALDGTDGNSQPLSLPDVG